MRRLLLALPLLLAGCYDPEPAPVVYAPPPGQPAPAGTVFWQRDGWTVERIPVPGGRPPGQYCAASHQTGGPDFALTETAAGLVGWSVADATGRASAGTRYPVTLRFDGLGALPYFAVVTEPGRLSGLPPDQGIARLASAARVVDVSSPVLGPIGQFDLTGSAAAIGALDQCARGLGQM